MIMMALFYVKTCFIFLIFLVVILLIQIAISSQKDIPLHYPSRINRSYDDDSGCNVVGILAHLISLVVFVFYILIIFGLIKACLGLCCSTYIGEIGLDILLDQFVPDYSRNTQFCMNVVFFLVLPFALFRKIRKAPRETSYHRHRMHAGAEPKPKETKINIIEPNILKPGTAKKKKGLLDIYRDGNDSETQDTKYVLEQLERSEQSLRSGVYACSMISG